MTLRDEVIFCLQILTEIYFRFLTLDRDFQALRAALCNRSIIQAIYIIFSFLKATFKKVKKKQVTLKLILTTFNSMNQTSQFKKIINETFHIRAFLLKFEIWSVFYVYISSIFQFD